MQAELTGEYLTVRVAADPADRHRWTVKPPGHVRDQIGRHGELVVSVTTRVLPTLLTPEDLPAAISDPEALTGRVLLDRP